MRLILILVLASVFVGIMAVGGSILMDRFGKMMNSNRRSVNRRSSGMDFLYEGSADSEQMDNQTEND